MKAFLPFLISTIVSLVGCSSPPDPPEQPFSLFHLIPHEASVPRDSASPEERSPELFLRLAEGLFGPHRIDRLRHLVATADDQSIEREFRRLLVESLTGARDALEFTSEGAQPLSPTVR